MPRSQVITGGRERSADGSFSNGTRLSPSLSVLGGNHAVRTERWRYIRYHDGGEELYDHSNDPWEWTNLAGGAEHAAVIGELRALLPDDLDDP